MSTQITTGKVRFSYCSLFEPRANNNSGDGQEKYSVTLLIDKGDKFTLDKIKAAVAEAKQNYLQKNSGKKLPSELKTTLHDGDGERPNGGDFGPECQGCYVMTVSSKNKPVLVDKNKNPITDPQELYSGWAHIVQQCVKLPPLGILPGGLLQKELVYRDIVTQHKLKEYL